MTKKIYVTIFTAIGLVLLINCVTFFYNANKPLNVTSFEIKQDQTLDKNVWKVLSFSESHYLKVFYKEKYGVEKKCLCKVVFENTKTGEYKCISPEIKSLVLQKDNLILFKISGSDSTND